jgi:tetratricopeptide (TPR) repeat protein
LLVRDGTGYRLRLTEDQLDLLVFRRLVGDARQARAAGAVGQACEAYERALALRRGEPLADIEVLRGHPAIVALADELAATVLEYTDVALSDSNEPLDRVLPHLRALAARDRLNEASHARLMITLAAGGRQAEALREYEELRRRLDEQLGVLPGPEVRGAYARVLRQEIPARAEPAGPDDAVERWTPVFQLPAAPADFTGRAAECERVISAAISASGQPGVPLVAMSGSPGVGKTALALYAAHRVRDQFPDGQLWVELAGSSARPRSPGDVLGELLRALGHDGSAIPDEDSERAASYRSRLAGRRVLVIVDDAASAAQVRLVMPGTAGCALVVTSRARLEGLDGAHLVPLDVMTTDDAAGLLTRIIGLHRVAADPPAAAELVRACGALPLALRIVGAKLATRPSWPVSAMVSKITGAHGRLGELRAGDLSVRASIASSYESLSEQSRRAFRLLALLGPSDFAEWAPGALLGDPGPDVVSELTDRSLLTPLSLDSTGEPRYRLHDLLRDFAAERLIDDPDASKKRALEHLLQGWLQLAYLADTRLPPEPFFPLPTGEPPWMVVPGEVADRITANPIGWFTSERSNLLIAVEQACDIGRLDLARQLAVRQCAFQYLQGRHDDAERMWGVIADGAEQSGDLAGAVHGRLRIGASMSMRGLAAEPLPLLGWCVTSAEQLDELETLALALYWRGYCAWDLDDFEQAQSDADRGVCVAREAGSRVAELMNLRILGVALAKRDGGDLAITFSEQALAIASDLGVASYELVALHNLAFTYTLTGHYERAVTVCLRRIQLSRELGDVRAEAQSHAVLGDAHHQMGDHQMAAAYLLQALPVFREHRTRRHHALCLLKLGYAYEAMGSYAEAIGYLGESSLMFRQLNLPRKTEQAEHALDRCRAVGASKALELGLGGVGLGGAQGAQEVAAGQGGAVGFGPASA